MTKRALHIDKIALALILAIVLLGLVMVTSASISIASKESGNPFAYLERQLVLCDTGFGSCPAGAKYVPDSRRYVVGGR